MGHPGEKLLASCVLDSLGTKEEHALMEEERERHSCAVVVVQSLEMCNMQGGNTEKQDSPPLPAVLGTALRPSRSSSPTSPCH